MDIILMRHGRAEAAQHSISDDARELTRKGKEETISGIPFLREKLDTERPILIWSSPAARAGQTAQIVAEGLGISDVVSQGFLYPGNGEVLMQSLPQISDDTQLIIVGHEPHLSLWSVRFFGTPLVFEKGMAAAFRVTQRSPLTADLMWVMTKGRDKDKKKLSEPPLSRKDFAEMLLVQAEKVLSLREDLLARPDEPAAVHAFRVQVRKLRSLIAFVKPTMDSADHAPLRNEFRTMHNRLSYLRETDVLLNLWQQLRDKHGLMGVSDLTRVFERERTKEARKVQVFAASTFVPDALVSLSEAIGFWADAEDRPDAFNAFASVRFKTWRGNIKTAVKELDIRDYAAIHLLRIRFKKLRYVQDALPPLSKESPLESENLKDIQDALGRICDIYINISALDKMTSPKLSREIGLFVGALMKQREELEKQARSLLKKK